MEELEKYLKQYRNKFQKEFVYNVLFNHSDESVIRIIKECLKDNIDVETYYEKHMYEQTSILKENLLRSELIQIIEEFNQEIKGKEPQNILKETYVSYLERLKEKLNSKKCISDLRFVTFCRRDFLKEEMSNRLNQKEARALLEAFCDLEDYIRNDTWISISSVAHLPNPHQIIDQDLKYKEDGFICKEEQEILLEMIEEFLKRLNNIL